MVWVIFLSFLNIYPNPSFSLWDQKGPEEWSQGKSESKFRPPDSKPLFCESVAPRSSLLCLASLRLFSLQTFKAVCAAVGKGVREGEKRDSRDLDSNLSFATSRPDDSGKELNFWVSVSSSAQWEW